MSAAVRSRLNIGIAVAGAGAIALAPINPSMPTISEPLAQSVSTAAVALSAAVNPIEQWAQIISEAFTNGAALVEAYLDNPAPILRQLILNGIGYGETTVTALQATVTNLIDNLRLDNPNGLPANLRNAWDLLLAGDIANGLPPLYSSFVGYLLFSTLPVINVLQIPIDMAQNFANVVEAGMTGIVGLVFGALSAPQAAVEGASDQLQAVYNAIQAGDWLGTINEVLGVPGAFVDGLVNGYGYNAGLLNPDGLVDMAIRALNTIAEALGAAPVATSMLAPFAAKVADSGPSALPSDVLTVETVTLDTDVVATGDGAPAATTETTPAESTLTDPVSFEPVASEPIPAEPSVTEPVATEPVATEPAATEPTATEPTTPSTDIETKPASKRESKAVSQRTSDDDTGSAGGSRSELSKKDTSTKSGRSTSRESRSDSTGSGKGSASSDKSGGESGSGSSGAAA